MTKQQEEELVGKIFGKKHYLKHYYITIKVLGADCSLMLCEFINKYYYHRDSKQYPLVDSKWFYYTRESIEKKFGFSEFKQRGLLKRLNEEGYIDWMFIPDQMPPRKYYTINLENIVELISKEVSDYDE